MYMKKRSLSLYHCLNMSLLFAMITVPIMLSMFAEGTSAEQILGANVGIFAFTFFWYLILVKNWLIYYKYKWTYYTLEMEWSHIINSNIASTESEQNWFIKNNKQYGNLEYIVKLFGLYFFILFIIDDCLVCLCIYSQFQVVNIIVTCAIVMPCFGAIGLFYYYLVSHTPYINDPFLIHWESRIHSKLLLAWVSTFSLTNVAVIALGDMKMYPIIGTSMNIVLFLMIYNSTHKLSKLQEATRHVQGQPRIRSSSSNSMEIDLEEATKTIDRMLANENTIHAFMVHLSKEYSMEVLLSYIEFCQYQKYVLQHMEHEQESTVEITDFPSNIPLSEIIEADELRLIDTCQTDVDLDTDGIHRQENSDNAQKYSRTKPATQNDTFLHDAKMKAYKLYHKYIKVGSEFEINIPSRERVRLSNLLGDMDKVLSWNVEMEDLLVLFEECKKEMRVLQTFALARFKYDNECRDGNV